MLNPGIVDSAMNMLNMYLVQSQMVSNQDILNNNHIVLLYYYLQYYCFSHAQNSQHYRINIHQIHNWNIQFHIVHRYA